MNKAKQNNKISKIIGRIIICIVLVIAVLLGVNTVATVICSNNNMKVAKSFEKVIYDEQLVPNAGEDGNPEFTTDRPFRIMQLTDIHIGGGWLSAEQDKKALNCVASMITEEKPDLVIVTGDVVFPTPNNAGTLNNKTGAKIFAQMMESLGVYWTVGFGNHDTEVYGYYSREDIGNYYSSDELKYCLFEKGPENVDGCGNQIINIKNSQGLITQSLFVFDSHSYTDKFGINGEYDNIHSNQIDWYTATINSLNEANKNTINNIGENDLPYPANTYENVKSLAFFHIPLTEYKDAWTTYVENGKTNSEELTYYYGTADESEPIVFSGAGEDNLFETMQSLKSTQGIFCGHDHINNFSIDYKGIRLTYGMSIDYLAYKDLDKLGDYRGCTIINVNPDGSFDCKNENYYQDKYEPVYEKESVSFVH
uniref:metallophosphoesterase n=1 Tax=Eubacterium sp. TaxID=142586 RepID=UPI0040254C37